MISHTHLIARAEIRVPPQSVSEVKNSLCELVDMIDMKLLGRYNQPEEDYRNPIASYCEEPGNEGMTAVALIETSHIILHVWDHIKPAVIEFDLYTCAPLDLDKVWLWFDRFEPTSINWELKDRATKIKTIGKGTMAFS